MEPYLKSKSSENHMEVIKRNGNREQVSFDKIIKRIKALCWELDPQYIDPIAITKSTIESLYNGISTEEIDFVSADICASQIMYHPDFNKLAARLCVSNLHKTTRESFEDVAELLYTHLDTTGNKCPLISDKLYEISKKYSKEIQNELDFDRDYLLNFFGIKTLERSYLMRLKNSNSKDIIQYNENKLRKKYGRIIERPQHLFMRVALGIHEDDLTRAFETYHYMSQKFFTHATPTMFNAGTPRPQLSSCFLLGMGDSISGIFKTVTDAAQISKWAGGIGIHISAIRSSGSLIRGTNGTSDGIVPLARLLSMLAKYVNQGGKRNGSIAIYSEPWHADIWEFVELRRNTGEEELRARDIFLALWIPNLFMERVEEDGMWSLMCPDECPGLTDAVGDDFKRLYEKYESEKRYRKQIKARELWHHILVSQIETGMPYMCYKDHANEKSNQKNLGTIKSSNLCSEIIEYSDENNYAVCNLASICLPAFLEQKDGKLVYNYQELYKVARIATRNLNIVIDRNYYPVSETKKSNMQNRPIGLGVQGLADVYNKLSLPFGSEESNKINRKIFETIYFGAMTESMEMAKEFGPYESYEGSPISKGIFQFNLWGFDDDINDSELAWDWKGLRENILKYGVRNSLVTAVMPTASTSQIMGNVECIEPYTTNMFVRTTIAGEYTVINENLVRDLLTKGLWTKDVRDELIFDGGSIQNIASIDDHLKQVYLTAFDMDQVNIIRQSVERGRYIDQSQSQNVFLKDPDFMRLTKSHFYGWKNGLKTGLYYLRSQPAQDPIKFGLDPLTIKMIKERRGITDEEVDDDEIIVPVKKNPSDPRRVNEIEEHLKQPRKKVNKYARPENIEDCLMCSG